MKTHENRALFSRALLKATTCLFLTAGAGISNPFANAPREVFKRSYSSSFSQCSTQFLYIFNLSNASFTVEPSGEVIPIPVITTLLTDKALR